MHVRLLPSTQTLQNTTKPVMRPVHRPLPAISQVYNVLKTFFSPGHVALAIRYLAKRVKRPNKQLDIITLSANLFKVALCPGYIFQPVPGHAPQISSLQSDTTPACIFQRRVSLGNGFSIVARAIRTGSNIQVLPSLRAYCFIFATNRKKRNQRAQNQATSAHIRRATLRGYSRITRTTSRYYTRFRHISHNSFSFS